MCASVGLMWLYTVVSPAGLFFHMVSLGVFLPWLTGRVILSRPLQYTKHISHQGLHSRADLLAQGLFSVMWKKGYSLFCRENVDVKRGEIQESSSISCWAAERAAHIKTYMGCCLETIPSLLQCLLRIGMPKGVHVHWAQRIGEAEREVQWKIYINPIQIGLWCC